MKPQYNHKRQDLTVTIYNQTLKLHISMVVGDRELVLLHWAHFLK